MLACPEGPGRPISQSGGQFRLLSFLPAFGAGPQAVTVALDGHDVHVVGQAIQQGARHPFIIGEHLRPRIMQASVPVIAVLYAPSPPPVASNAIRKWSSLAAC